jgi:hypothetical protein
MPQLQLDLVRRRRGRLFLNGYAIWFIAAPDMLVHIGAAMRAGTDTIRKPLLWGGFHHSGAARPNTTRNSLITASSSRIALSIASQLAAMNSPSSKISSVQC